MTGCKQLEITDPETGISFPVVIHYPSMEPSKPTAFGPYMMDVAMDAPMIAGKYPLVLISHGSGGSHLIYHTITRHLAQNGFIVAMTEHYGNNRVDNHLGDSVENLQYRPRHLKMTIDRLLDHPDFGKNLNGKVAVIGHSMGGYTALALAGGTPRTMEGEVITVDHDPRVVAAVLLAPATGWFMHGLDKVSIPILILMAEHDSYTPLWNAEVVEKSVPDPSKVITKVIKGAGHFSFLSPFPEALKKLPGFLPATDPPGFDREKFHEELKEMILEFLGDIR